MLKLYDLQLSGHAHKIRLFCNILGVDYTSIPVDLPGGEHMGPDFKKLNPFSKIPVLDDDGTIIRDSNAILVYIAVKHGNDHWFPKDALGMARVQEWLAVSTNEVMHGPALARAIKVFGVPLDYELAFKTSHGLFEVMNDHLAGRDWLAADHETIADLACYSYIALASDGDIDLAPYPNIVAWLKRVEGLDGFEPVIA